MKSAGNRDVIQSRLQMLPVHVSLAAPLGARLCHVAGTGQHQGDKFVVPSLCGADVEVHQAVNQGGKRYITHIVQTWYEANKNKGIMFRMQGWVESGKNGEHWE